MRDALLGSLMACVLLLGLCGVAVAAEKKFNHYSIDLPNKCTATEKEGIVTVSCGQDSFFSIGIFTKAEAGGLSTKQFAEKHSARLKGTAPAKADDGGGWTFQAMSGRVMTHADVSSEGDMTMLFISDVSDKDWPEALQKAYDSLRGADNAADSLIQKSLFERE
ncbi:MAG: hypothetical protein F8N36_15135 [Desulfovibrio sp.]|uniref:hypothetical protein n=1 Tax=Desulfovibrio sp. TaxID=885 RepID=UPI00135D3871|nr:hypothetical protein [Desulfovibrio sp.]MTJ94174.1 hypothetical protein [Desulfovibrio sp.]